MTDFKHIGGRDLRTDALAKVTGEATYTADIQCKGMLHGKILTSKIAHGRILSIDTSEAEKLPGVVTVITREDSKKYPLMGEIADRGILCHDKVRYYGDMIAAVAATTKEIAEEAVGLIKVEIEELPAVFTCEEAFAKGCKAVIHENLADYEVEEGLRCEYDEQRPNQFQHRTIRQGDVEAGFNAAKLIVEETYELPQVSQCYLEPCAALVIPGSDGGLTIYASEQEGYSGMVEMAYEFGIPVSKVHYNVPYLGGAFGGKDCIAILPIAVLLALKAGRPVRLEHDREESFVSGNPRSMAKVTIKDGFDKDGKLLARKIFAIVDGGAYSTNALEVASNCVYGAIGNYAYENLQIDCYGVYTNTSGKGAYRSLGSEIMCFAIENNMNQAAARLGIDPVQLRLKNLLQDGDVDGAGQVVVNNDAAAALRLAAEKFDWDGSRSAADDRSAGVRCGAGTANAAGPSETAAGPWVRGRGVSIGNKICVIGDMGTSATCKIRMDGTVEVCLFHVEMGQGAHTVDAMSAAEVFDMPLEKIKVTFGDSAQCPHDVGTYYSKGSFVNGLAVKMAAEKVLAKTLDFAAEKFGLDAETLYSRDGYIYSRADEDVKIHFSELYEETGWIECGELTETATYVSEGEPYDEFGQSPSYAAYYSHGAWCVEILLNKETGEIVIDRVVGMYDCGQVLNEATAKAQLEGSFSMGMAQAIYEECIFDEKGKILNANFRDYRIPTFMDGPARDDLQCGFVGGRHEAGPWGAKGIGEVAMIPVMPAVGSAIVDAMGVQLNRLPLSRERILQAIRGSES